MQVKGYPQKNCYVFDEEWYENHRTACNLKHTGSAGVMEVAKAKNIYHRSVEKHGLSYTKFLGD